ncbi:hypothetical protein [Caminibacter pacificus]|uniref:Uncharacterized protein n=1 Tax=Caminibacter pacificus TaxID=1424653 RepID=A0AAJ4RAT1_9BACT|nr:hypothetical protein [Caminibacter pacificus]QDD68151.1 hypothetical protein C6V80_09870 [Caminibacter pacificus]ROR38769.1 hypothetical protein EDC58_1984 [Caminibacter pacificus]
MAIRFGKIVFLALLFTNSYAAICCCSSKIFEVERETQKKINDVLSKTIQNSSNINKSYKNILIAKKEEIKQLRKINSLLSKNGRGLLLKLSEINFNVKKNQKIEFLRLEENK